MTIQTAQTVLNLLKWERKFIFSTGFNRCSLISVSKCYLRMEKAIVLTEVRSTSSTSSFSYVRIKTTSTTSQPLF